MVHTTLNHMVAWFTCTTAIGMCVEAYSYDAASVPQVISRVKYSRSQFLLSQLQLGSWTTECRRGL